MMSKQQRRLLVICEHCGREDTFVDVIEADRAGWTCTQYMPHSADIEENWVCGVCLREMVRKHATNEDWRAINKYRT